MTRTTWFFGALLLLAGLDAAADWRACAKENAVCAFEGTREVQYGAGSKWITRTFTNGVKCDNASFGVDPLQGKEKSCKVSTVRKDTPSVPQVTSRWPRCGNEGGFCPFEGQRRVAYGINGKFFQRVATGGIKCSNEAFGGDPYPGKAKGCFLNPQ